MQLDQMLVFEKLKVLKEKAYAPYSNFKVSCIIFLKNDKTIEGVNVENAAYNPSICAERVALPQMICQGYNKNDVKLVALYTDSSIFGSPCGTCRQTLHELLNEDQEIWIFNKNGFLGSYTVKDFLPYAFTCKNL